MTQSNPRLKYLITTANTLILILGVLFALAVIQDGAAHLFHTDGQDVVLVPEDQLGVLNIISTKVTSIQLESLAKIVLGVSIIFGLRRATQVLRQRFGETP
jgi:hypothetical protein